MKRAAFVLAVVLTVALAGQAMAGEKRKIAKVFGTLISAEVAGGTLKLKVTLEDGGEGEFEMAGPFVVMYGEKNGKTRLMMIRKAGKKTPEAKGNRKVVTGDTLTITVAGRKATVVIGEVTLEMPAKISIAIREKNGEKQVVGITPGRGKGGGRKKKDAADAAK